MTKGPDLSGKLTRPANNPAKSQPSQRSSSRSADPDLLETSLLMEELRTRFGSDSESIREIREFLEGLLRNHRPEGEKKESADSPDHPVSQKKTIRGDEITHHGDVLGPVLNGAGDITIWGDIRTGKEANDDEDQHLEKLERSYYSALVNRVNSILLSQLVIKSSTSSFMPEIELERLYIPLDCTVQAETLKNSDQSIQQEPILNVINRRKEANFVILGDPGSGKSTFINYLTLALASALLKPGEEETYYKNLETSAKGAHKVYQWDRSKVWRPIRIELSDLADSIPEGVKKGEARYVNDYLKSHLRSIAKEALQKRFESYLADGKCFVMFDGLDEVYSSLGGDNPANGKARIVRQCIENFIEANPGNRYLVTCRLLSYQNEDVKLNNRIFQELHLAPLTEASIKYFITNWYTAITNEKRLSNAEAFARVRSLKRSCTGELYDIARNPMLLTVMAIIHTYSKMLPKYKNQLYKECIDLLLFQWNQSKLFEEEDREWRICDLLDVPQNQLMSGLCRLAFFAQNAESRSNGEGRSTRIPRSGLVRVFQPYMGGTEPEARKKAEDISNYIEKRAGLLIGKGKNSRGELIYSFAHRGFQEYLAALYILNQRGISEKIYELCIAGGFWQEVVMLAIGELVYSSPYNTAEVLDIIDRLVPKNPDSDKEEDWRRIWWGGEMLNMVGIPLANNDDERRNLIPLLKRLLVRLITTDKLSPVERARAADALSQLGDPRPGVTNPILDPEKDLVLFPAKTISVGGAEQPPVRVDPFYVCRYPVTNSQFRVFVSDSIKGGSSYAVRDFWTDAGKKWVKESKKGAGGFIHDHAWGSDNRPVCGITWYEAEAYVRWLSHKTGEKYRLLTEAEWEYAASGGTGRAFPWGDRKVANQTMANTSESGIGETCSVGIFTGDKTEEGIYDLGGNVYEWTSSLAKPLPYRRGDGRENPEGEGERVLRGGCYARDTQSSHCADRQTNSPDTQMPLIGFRVAKDASKK